jgi:hypothetical protein
MEWSNKQKAKHPPWGLHKTSSNAMRIKSHVKNDVGEKMVVQFIYNVILKPIPCLQIAQKREPK